MDVCPLFLQHETVGIAMQEHSQLVHLVRFRRSFGPQCCVPSSWGCTLQSYQKHAFIHSLPTYVPISPCIPPQWAARGAEVNIDVSHCLHARAAVQRNLIFSESLIATSSIMSGPVSDSSCMRDPATPTNVPCFLPAPRVLIYQQQFS